MRRNVIVAGAVFLAAPVACSRSEPSSSRTSATSSVTSRNTSGASASASASVAASAGDATVIHTADNAVVLGLAHDTVYMGLSDSLLTKTRAEMAHDGSDTGDMGGALAGFIKRRVGSALGMRVRYPISDIQSVRYENGEIKFEYRHKHAMSFESVSSDRQKALAAFAPDDARRFVAAVNAALRMDDNAQ